MGREEVDGPLCDHIGGSGLLDFTQDGHRHGDEVQAGVEQEGGADHDGGMVLWKSEG